MPSFNSIPEAVTALRALAFNPQSGLPADIAAQLQEIAGAGSAVRAIIDAAELIFARRADLSAEHLQLGAALASYATLDDWHGFASTNRGSGLVRALRRDAGDEAEVGKWPEPEHDPEPLQQFAPEAAVDVLPELAEQIAAEEAKA